MRTVTYFFSLSLFILLALPPWRAHAVNVTLGWYPSSSPDVAGYDIRYGLESGHYIYKVPTGTNTSGTVTGLLEGQTYYFVVTVYNTNGVESDPSNEVGYTVPGMAAPGTPWIQMDPTSGQPVLKWNPSASPGVAGYRVYYGTTSGNHPLLVFSQNATAVTLSSLGLATNGYFVVRAYDSNGRESTDSAEISSRTALPNSVGVIPAPTLQLTRTPAPGLPGVFAVNATGAIPAAWALEASKDLQTWKTITAGSNTAVNVTVVVTPKPKLFFRLAGSQSGVQMKTQTFPNAFPNSFRVTTAGTAPASWIIQTSDNLQTWSDLVSGANPDVNVAVVPSNAAGIFFRLKSQ